jgi:hypothetical protein
MLFFFLVSDVKYLTYFHFVNFWDAIQMLLWFRLLLTVSCFAEKYHSLIFVVILKSSHSISIRKIHEIIYVNRYVITCMFSGFKMPLITTFKYQDIRCQVCWYYSQWIFLLEWQPWFWKKNNVQVRHAAAISINRLRIIYYWRLKLSWQWRTLFARVAFLEHDYQCH